MPKKTLPARKKVKTKPDSKKPAPKTDADNIRALEEQLAQRDAEIARFSNENQRLLKETEQRATELQIINNIGQTLTEGLDLNTTLEGVGERLREALKVESIGIIANDIRTGLVISSFVYLKGKRVIPDRFSLSKNLLFMRFVERMGGKPLVINTNVEKNWRKFLADSPEWAEIPKAFVMVPLLAGGELVGSITIPDYEKEDAFTDLPINLLETIASNMGTAIQNVRLFDETQRLLKETEQRATELQIINNIGQILTEGGDLNSTIQRVGDRLREVLKVGTIGISVWDEKIEHIIARYSYLKGKPTSGETWDANGVKVALRLSARGGGRSWIVNKNVEKAFRKFGGGNEAEIPKSFVQLPLLAGGKFVGGLSIVDYESEDAFTDLPIRLLETIASNMGTVIQNARLFDETQRLLMETEQRATELQIINSVQADLVVQMDLQAIYDLVGEKIRNLFDAQTVDIAIYDPVENLLHFRYTIERGEYFPIEPRPLMGFRKHVIESRQYLLINDLTREERAKYGQPAPIGGEPARSVLFMPMVVGEEVKGVISLQNLDRTNAFSDTDVRLLQTFANSMTVALENARLFDETQSLLKETEQRATELQIINNIGQTITGELDLNTLIEHVGDKLRETFNVKSIRIGVADTNTGFLISLYMYRNGKRVAFDESWQSKSDRYRSIMRASARAGGRSWVVNTNAEKGWRKFALVIDEEDIPKSFVMLPLLAGREVIGGIYIPNYEKENAFTDFSIGMLETIASNMGTAIQNVRLFDETKKLFKEAEEARAAAEQANKAKSTFLANMSHELRTPLNAIMGFTSIVRDKSQSVLPEKQINNLEKVLASSQHLLGLINTVLDLAKIEAGRMDVIPAKFHLNALIDLCGNLSTPLLKSNVTLEKQVDDTIGIIYSDQDKIKQILLNLLSNAAKFTHEGKIVLGVEKVDTYTSTQGNTPADSPVYLSPYVRVYVKDSGIGIKADAIDRVFEEFQQADATTTRQYGGTGLGLPISRSLARLLGGDLTAASEPGKGSTFTLTIPTQYGRKPAALSNPTPDTVQPTETHTQAGLSQS